MKGYKYLFFDLDRTLWDYEINSLEAFKDIISELKLNSLINDPAYFKERYSYHNEVLWEQYKTGEISKEYLSCKRFEILLEEFNINDNNIVKQFESKYLLKVPTKNNLFPHTIETLKYLVNKDYQLSIITNGFEEIQYKKMENTNIKHFFKHIIISEKVGVKKPAPKIFDYALKKCKASKSNSLMIGDDLESDIVGAANFGIDQVFYNPEKTKTQKQFIKPTYTISEITELTKIL
jgi:putative hydrolase of the HAD superfamily